MNHQRMLLKIKRRLKLNWFVWVFISIFSSMRSLQVVRWKFDGTDWKLVNKDKSLFTNRFQAKCTWLLEGHSSIFEKMYSPKMSDRILDVGGGLGLDLPRWSKLIGPDGHIWVIEPDDDAFRRCSKLIQLLPLRNVTIIKKALGASQSIATLAKVSGNSHKNFIIASGFDLESSYETQFVDVVTLDEIFVEYDMERLNFCKVNVEGFEVNVLKGAQIAKGFIDNLVVSCHDFLGKDFATFDEVSSILNNSGFKVQTNPHAISELERFYLYAKKFRAN